MQSTAEIFAPRKIQNEIHLERKCEQNVIKIHSEEEKLFQIDL